MNTTKNTLTAGGSLVSVMILMAVCLMMLVVMVSMISALTQSSAGALASTDALFAAQSTADDLILKLVRDPSITPAPGSSIQYPNAVGYPSLTPAAPPIPGVIVAQGVSGTYTRTIEVIYQLEDDGRVTVISRNEIIN
jgi:hypothetical protein